MFYMYQTLIYALLAAHSVLSARPDRITNLALDSSQNKRNKKHDTNLRPLIGIVSQPGRPAPDGSSYIAASYIKFVEAAGARAVPILHDMTEDEIRRRFKAVNGILIPGGGQDLTPGHSFYDTVSLLFDLAIEANDNEDFFPIHGTCLGFQTLAVIASQNTSVLSFYDSEDDPKPLFPTELAHKSNFFTSLPPHVVENLYTKPYTMENHMHGVAYNAFPENPKLDDFFNVLTLSIDRKNVVYVSTMEAKDYPITATQWHPEKNAFEWSPDLHIPHHPDAIEITQEVGNLFVSAARKNQHTPASLEEEEELLIYNWNEGLRYTGRHFAPGEEVNFDEIYVFPDVEKLT